MRKVYKTLYTKFTVYKIQHPKFAKKSIPFFVKVSIFCGQLVPRPNLGFIAAKDDLEFIDSFLKKNKSDGVQT